jgi:hypothetical protein
LAAARLPILLDEAGSGKENPPKRGKPARCSITLIGAPGGNIIWVTDYVCRGTCDAPICPRLEEPMKKLLTMVAAFGMAAGLPHVAHAMECCKDGKCECCKKDEASAPTPPKGDHQH